MDLEEMIGHGNWERMVGNREGSDFLRAMRAIDRMKWVSLHPEVGTLSVEIEGFLETKTIKKGYHLMLMKIKIAALINLGKDLLIKHSISVKMERMHIFQAVCLFGLNYG